MPPQRSCLMSSQLAVHSIRNKSKFYWMIFFADIDFADVCRGWFTDCGLFRSLPLPPQCFQTFSCVCRRDFRLTDRAESPATLFTGILHAWSRIFLFISRAFARAKAAATPFNRSRQTKPSAQPIKSGGKPSNSAPSCNDLSRLSSQNVVFPIISKID